jgi:hypothetical protein
MLPSSDAAGRMVRFIQHLLADPHALARGWTGCARAEASA